MSERSHTNSTENELLVTGRIISAPYQVISVFLFLLQIMKNCE